MPRKRNASQGSAPSPRGLKMGEEIRRILSDAFMRGDIYDRETGRAVEVTVSEVRVTPNLYHATVYIAPLGGKDTESVMQTIRGMAGALRGLVAQRLQARYTPSLRFELDTSFDTASRMEAILGSPAVKRDLEERE